MTSKQRFDELLKRLADGTATMADYALFADLEDVLESEAIAELD